MFGTNKTLDDIPEMFTKYSKDTPPIKKDYKGKNNDMLFLLLIILLFYDNKF